MDRRTFLTLAGGAGTAAALAAAVGPRALDALFHDGPTRAALPPAAPASVGPLVLVTLYGGNDGLSTVVPVGDPAYPAVRGPLALDPSTLLPITEGFALHPSLPGLKKLWDGGRLAVVHGVGFADPNYSHFASMDIWQAGSTTAAAGSGWVGRWLDTTGSDPLRALALGPTTPLSLSGKKVHGVAIPAGPLSLPGGPAELPLYQALSQTSPGRAATLAAQAAAANATLVQAQRVLGPALGSAAGADPLHLKAGTATSPAHAPDQLAIADGGGGQGRPGILATQLSVVANLILAGAPSRVYNVDLGGFDTHSNQAPTQQTLLAELDTAVSAFADAMAASARGRHAVVLVYTEFGRRVPGNGSAGSDHGWANVVLAAGPGVRGGHYGQPPSLTRLSEGNLVYTTDFRAVYASVLGAVLETDPRSVLGGAYPALRFV